MAEFRKCFDNLDTEKRGVITIDDLKNYMLKMHYKETFLQKWIELFDPEHTGLITYEQYCKTLGLIPRKRTTSKTMPTDSSQPSISSNSASPQSVEANGNNAAVSNQGSQPSESNTTRTQPPSSKEPSFVQDTDQEKLVTHIHEKEKIKITIHTVEKCSTNQSPLPPPSVVDTNNNNNNNQIEDIPRKDVVVHHQEESNDEIRLVTNTVKIVPVNQEKLNRRKRKYTDERCEDPASGRSVLTANEGDKIPTDNSNVNTTIHQTIYNETLIIDQSKLDLIEHLKPNDEEMHSTSSPSSVGQLSHHHQQEQSPTEQPHINISNKSTKKHKKKKKQPEQTIETATTDVHCESTPGLVRSELNDVAMLVDEECLIKASEETVILENYYQENVTLTTTTTTSSSMNSTQPENENTGEAVKVMAKPKSPLSNNNAEVHFTGLVSPMSPMTSVSAMSISIDSGHSGSNDTTLSLVGRTTLETDTSYTTMSVSPQVFDGNISRISTPSSTSTNAMMVPESNQPSKWLSSDEVGVRVVPQTHGDSCVVTSHDQKIPKQEAIGKMGKKADKKKKGKTSPDTIESQVVVTTDIPLVDSHPEDEFIQKSVIQSYAVHTIKHDFVNSVNDGTTVSPIENRETPESLIIPRIINSMYTKTPEEFDRDTEPTQLSTKLSEIEIAPTQVVNNQLSKKESKKSKKKHQKIDQEINKTVDPDFSTTDNFDQMISIPESTALSVEEEKWRQESSSLQATVVEHFHQTIVLNTSVDEVKIHPVDATMCEVDGEDLESGVSMLPATEIGFTQASKKESKKSKKKHHKIIQEFDKPVDLDFNTTDSFDQMISIPESTAQTVKEAEWQELNLPDCQTSLQAPVVEHFQKTVVNTSMVDEMKIHPIDDTVHVVDIQSDISTLPVVTEIDSTPIVVNQELKKESKKSKKKHQKSNQAVDKTVDPDFITTDNFDQMMSTPESIVQPVEKAKGQELSSTNSQTSLQTPVEEHFQQTIVLNTSMSEMKVHPTGDTVSDLSLQSGISMLPQTEFDSTPVGNLSSKKESKKNKKKHQKTSEEIIDKTVVPDFITSDNFDQMISLPERSTTPQPPPSEEVKLQELIFSNCQTSLQVPILKPSNQIIENNISMDEVKLYPMDTTMSDAAPGEHLQSNASPMLQKSTKPTTVAGLKTTPSIEKLSDEIQASSYEVTTGITETNQPKASENINKSKKPTKSSIQTKIHGELGEAVNQLLQLHDPELVNTQTNNQSSSSVLKQSSKKKPKKSPQPVDDNNEMMNSNQNNVFVNSTTVPVFLQNSVGLNSVTAAAAAVSGDQLPVCSLVDNDIEMKESSLIIPSLNSSQPSNKSVDIQGKSKKKKANNNNKAPLNTDDSKNSMRTESTLLYSNEKIEKPSLSSSLHDVVKKTSNDDVQQIPDRGGNSKASKKVAKTPNHFHPTEQPISVSTMKVSLPKEPKKNKKLQLKKQKQKSKKSKLDGDLHQMNSLNGESVGKSKKPYDVDDGTTNNNNDKESQENTRKRRFPRSYATQVDPSSIRSARRAAKRRKTDKPVEEKHDDSSEKPDQNRKRTIKRKRNQIMKKWCIRSSLRESGVIVILLAGRHRGKRVVCLGRHKSSGLLLVTGPYRYNGCPLRRVHPNYVIATKTKIDLSNLSLPNRIHQKEYFARSTGSTTTGTTSKSRKVNNQKRLEDILEHGVESQKHVYKPSDEKKSDQRLIDDEVRKAIKSHSDSQMLIRYLRSLFSISKHDRPHEMSF